MSIEIPIKGNYCHCYTIIIYNNINSNSRTLSELLGDALFKMNFLRDTNTSGYQQVTMTKMHGIYGGTIGTFHGSIASVKQESR